jgi:transcriptional regulator GlxA family with amidase domain
MSEELYRDSASHDSCELSPLVQADSRPCQFPARAVTCLSVSDGQTTDKGRNNGPQYTDEASSVSRIFHNTQRVSGTASIQGGLAPWQLRQIELYLDDNLAKTIRIRDLAVIARLSCSYFFQAFRCTTGKSPHNYILRRRIARAQELMLLTELSLSQIALDCGLADQPHLTRLFCRIVGTSPAKWRRMNSTLK